MPFSSNINFGQLQLIPSDPPGSIWKFQNQEEKLSKFVWTLDSSWTKQSPRTQDSMPCISNSSQGDDWKYSNIYIGSINHKWWDQNSFFSWLFLNRSTKMFQMDVGNVSSNITLLLLVLTNFCDFCWRARNFRKCWLNGYFLNFSWRKPTTKNNSS